MCVRGTVGLGGGVTPAAAADVGLVGTAGREIGLALAKLAVVVTFIGPDTNVEASPNVAPDEPAPDGESGEPTDGALDGPDGIGRLTPPPPLILPPTGEAGAAALLIAAKPAAELFETTIPPPLPLPLDDGGAPDISQC